MKTPLILGALVLAASACANQTPAQQHEVACITGSFTGALLGGAAGSLIGGGTGRDIAIAAGSVAGGYAGQRYSCG
ncbi:glycine zipper 2TM domain-containing protein [Paracoccus sp. PAR01]|uniref:glycine zipper 2TM domain-containing protein n=1 Tax=Paracoccus TaxID=265 RepID=UPI00351C2B32